MTTSRKPADGITGHTYLEHGRPVVVEVRWATSKPAADEPEMPLLHLTGPAPRNVRIRRYDGTIAVRPFRGLRVPHFVTVTRSDLRTDLPPHKPLDVLVDAAHAVNQVHVTLQTPGPHGCKCSTVLFTVEHPAACANLPAGRTCWYDRAWQLEAAGIHRPGQRHYDHTAEGRYIAAPETSPPTFSPATADQLWFYPHQ